MPEDNISKQDDLNREYHSLKKELNRVEDQFRQYGLTILMRWFFRWFLTAILYYIFWDYEWLRWSLIIAIPLGIFSLGTIFFAQWQLKWKIRKVKKSLNRLN